MVRSEIADGVVVPTPTSPVEPIWKKEEFDELATRKRGLVLVLFSPVTESLANGDVEPIPTAPLYIPPRPSDSE
jgi:hypothetical protein